MGRGGGGLMLGMKLGGKSRHEGPTLSSEHLIKLFHCSTFNNSNVDINIPLFGFILR